MKAIISLIYYFIFINECNAQFKLFGIFEGGYEKGYVSLSKINQTYYSPSTTLDTGVLFPDFDTMRISYIYNNTLYGILEIGLKWKKGNNEVSLYTNNKTYFRPNTIVSYQPLITEFRIGIKYIYKFAEVGYEHMCLHSIDKEIYNADYDRVYFKIQFNN
jgi:hypothetical protein